MTSHSEQQAKAFKELTYSRRSVRAFLAQPLNQTVLDSIFETANTAPSNCNTQPWHTYVASGAKRDLISQRLLNTIGAGDNVLDFPYDAKYLDVYRKRQLDVAILLYDALGVTRHDKQGRMRAFLRNLEFFGAPHVAFIFMPDWCDIREASDVGMFAQNLMLSIAAHGAASCPQTILSYNADVVREAFAIEPNMKLLYGLSFGYEDKSRPENKILPERAALATNTHFQE